MYGDAADAIRTLVDEIDRLNSDLAILQKEAADKDAALEALRAECVKLNQFEATQSTKLLTRCSELEHKIERLEAKEASEATVQGGTMTEKRLIVKWEEDSVMQFCNLLVTKIEHEQGYVVAYNDDEMVGAFDIGFIDVLYVSEARG